MKKEKAKMPENNRAAVYARYSSRKQGEQSIEGQLSEAYKYAETHGYNIIHEYIDRAKSGRTDNREAFQEMLRDTAKGTFSTIILWKLDRFGRNREEIAANKYRCKKNGVKVVYVAENVPDSPEGVILESVLEGMAEYYSLQLSQNVRRGMHANAEKCQSTGGTTPLGYAVDPATKKFVIDPNTAPTVRRIFDMYAGGTKISEIVRTLNDSGIRTARGSRFKVDSLYTVLRNVKYTGIYTYNGDVRIENGIPAIVDRATFEKVQEMLKVNKRKPSKLWDTFDYILTDKLFCGMCGSKMIGESGTSKNGTKHSYYTCVKKRRDHACKKKAVRQYYIETLVLDRIAAILDDDSLLAFIADNVYSYYVKLQNDDDMTDALKKRLREVEKAQINILRAIEAGVFNDMTKARMDELDEQKSELQAQIAEEEYAKTGLATRDTILAWLYSQREKDLNDRASQRQLIETFVNAIYVFDDRIEILFNYSRDRRSIKFEELSDLYEYGDVFVSSALSFTNTHRNEHISFVVWHNVFAVSIAAAVNEGRHCI